MIALRIFVAAAAFGLAGCAALGQDVRPAPPAPAAAPPRPAVVLSLSGNTPPHALLRLDPRTLRPAGRAIALEDNVSVAACSPNGRRVALGSNERARIDIVDLGQMRLLRTISLGGSSWIARIAWPSRNRILVVLEGPLRISAVNPRTGAHTPFRRLHGTALAHEAAGGSIAFLLAPTQGIGPARVAISDGERVRSVTLEGIAGGTQSLGGGESGEPAARTLVPAFAVEPGGRRAVVVSPAGRIAEVDLASLSVRYHDPGSQASLLGRVRNWLEPRAGAKLLEGAQREAVWLASGLVVVSGADYQADVESGATPAGATVVDTRDWSRRTLERGAMSVQRMGDGFALLRWGPVRTIATLYDGAATRRFRLVRDSLELVPVGRRLVAVSRAGVRREALDPRTGRVLARRSAEPSSWLLVAGG